MSHLDHSAIRGRLRAGRFRLPAVLSLAVIAGSSASGEPGLLEARFLAQPPDDSQAYEPSLESALVDEESGLPAVAARPLVAISPPVPAATWIGDDWMWNLESTATLLPQPAGSRPAEQTGAASLLQAAWTVVGRPPVLMIGTGAVAAAAICLLVTLSRAV